MSFLYEAVPLISVAGPSAEQMRKRKRGRKSRVIVGMEGRIRYLTVLAYILH